MNGIREKKRKERFLIFVNCQKKALQKNHFSQESYRIQPSIAGFLQGSCNENCNIFQDLAKNLERFLQDLHCRNNRVDVMSLVTVSVLSSCDEGCESVLNLLPAWCGVL